MTRIRRCVLPGATCLALAACQPSAQADLVARQSTAQTPRDNEDVFPPWQQGHNNDATDRGLAFTVPEIDDLADFHGDLTDPKLVLFVGGNYFFAMAPLVAEFEREHRDYKGRLYWETLPPGLLIKQIQAGGRVTSGNMTWTVKPDAYFAGLKKIDDYIRSGLLAAPAVPYVVNTLTIMIPKDNPAHVTSLADLGGKDIRLAMPNPAYEGIVRQIEAALRKAGGEALAEAVYKTKVADGTTVLTHIHHRQTPLFLMQGRADAGVTWQSEAIFQEQAGHAISHVDIPADQNATAIYAGAMVRAAAHPQAARLWLDFIHSGPALAIFERYGFKAYHAATGGASTPQGD
ncbi:substrate-binding domain-containing protein [Acidomonas methanolica]|uniref:substrate-binding domain-containing protein n=1 Tax=Acidomonas methanolica TaxID=437 RepID=UPI002119D24F|nr:substrate-binding domain-containing protein [Acidomonas methanolica]MCQ9154197.1 substrate-binding domain-containing protein [Acidomonas methanolica]